MLNKKWRDDTEYVSERAITATMVVNHQRIKLMSVYFSHSGYADHHVEKNVQKDREAHRLLEETSMQCGTECTSVGKHASNGGNKRGDWMKHWLMLQGFTALSTMYRKTPQKQTTFISPKGNEKPIGYILIKRRYLRHNKDAEANDMIHMGSGHRCVMATFTITTLGKSSRCKTKEKFDTTRHEGRDQTDRNIGVENPELEKRYQAVNEKIQKNRRHKKKQQRKQKHENAETQAKNENAEGEAEEAEGTCTGTMVNDGVETTGEAGGRHSGLHTVNEEAGHIVFHTEHVEHDMNDDTGGRTKTMHDTTNANGEQTEIVIENENAEAEAEEVEGMPTETMLNDAVGATGGTGEEHPELSIVNEKSDHIVGEEHHARSAHSDEEAGSIVLHVSCDMNEREGRR